MKKIIIIFIIFPLLLTFCKEEKKICEPAYVLQKWSKAIKNFDYKLYTKCEAYPKNKNIFKKIYKNYYICDIMVIEVEKPDKKNIRKDHNDNSFIHRKVTFEGTSINRSDNKPFQLVRGDIVFIKFEDGNRKNDGWLISNRTIVRINK